MNGPKHYAEAERLMVTASHAREFDDHQLAAYALHLAQIHATLAQGAAAIAAAYGTLSIPDSEAWSEVLDS